MFFLFFPENRIKYVMQIISNEMPNSVFWEEKKEKYFKMLSGENFTQSTGTKL